MRENRKLFLERWGKECEMTHISECEKVKGNTSISRLDFGKKKRKLSIGKINSPIDWIFISINWMT